MGEDMFEGAGWTDLVEMCGSVPAKGEGDAVCTIWVRCRGAWEARTTPALIIYKRTLQRWWRERPISRPPGGEEI